MSEWGKAFLERWQSTIRYIAVMVTLIFILEIVKLVATFMGYGN